MYIRKIFFFSLVWNIEITLNFGFIFAIIFTRKVTKKNFEFISMGRVYVHYEYNARVNFDNRLRLRNTLLCGHPSTIDTDRDTEKREEKRENGERERGKKDRTEVIRHPLPFPSWVLLSSLHMGDGSAAHSKPRGTYHLCTFCRTPSRYFVESDYVALSRKISTSFQKTERVKVNLRDIYRFYSLSLSPLPLSLFRSK